MDLETLKSVFSDSLSASAIGAMSVAAALDIVAAIVDALRTRTFSWTYLPKWLESKVLEGILPVIILYVASLAFADPLRATFAAGASAGAAMFIAAQGASILNHLKTKPVEEPVPDEIVGG